MTLERSSYQMSSDRVNELLSKERQLFAIADVWSDYKQAKTDGLDGADEFVALALRLDTAVKEAEPTEPMCVYCGWGGEDLAKHEQGCKPMWATLDEKTDDEEKLPCNECEQFYDDAEGPTCQTCLDWVVHQPS